MTDRARRVVLGAVPAAEHEVIPGTQTPPLQPPAGASGPAPLGLGLSSSKAGRWVGTRYSPSLYPPGIPSQVPTKGLHRARTLPDTG